ncbi:hypothetical protein L596_025894 [Steinernema carpocapsae]|uniref:Small ribosomal subunit protein mS31 n=1 Tax=Steinernema carpocapsae TaxID=34508 RepID=A0A4U5M958_STECR|nr:hypothetical protein L596_025894 [Steinernema carpocapsae]
MGQGMGGSVRVIRVWISARKGQSDDPEIVYRLPTVSLTSGSSKTNRSDLRTDSKSRSCGRSKENCGPYPINNEHKLGEEENVGFQDHIFLERFLAKAKLPKTGPVAHFMELVCVGLSKNPHMTAAKKREHIQWCGLLQRAESGTSPPFTRGRAASRSQRLGLRYCC